MQVTIQVYGENRIARMECLFLLADHIGLHDGFLIKDAKRTVLTQHLIRY